jgi:methionyl-tRNA formyltransferase
MLGEERIKCWDAELLADVSAAPGQVVSADAGGVVVAGGEGAVGLLELQRPGKRRVNAAQFAEGTEIAGKQL